MTHACTNVVMALGVLGRSADGAALQGASLAGAAHANERGYPIPAADSVGVDAQAQVMLVRSNGLVFAVSPACPHEQAVVRWVARAGRFQCSKHHSRYTREGQYISGRATRGLDRFAIRRDGPAVFVDVTRLWRADKNPAEWTAAVVSAI
jgi:nitrite reductase/ring-hydroxylating ferredoxin subunit